MASKSNNAPKQGEPPAARPGPTAISLSEAMNARDRRGKIVLALYRCMTKRGYAATTLCDIADEAGMTSSHLLYYYSGKEAILEAFFKAVTDRIEKQLAELDGFSPEAKISAIANMFLSARGLRKVDQGVMLDLYGQAVQNKVMRRVKVTHDRCIKDMFVELFEQTPLADGLSAEEAAQSAYAMLLGLRANSFYDSQLTAAQANRLFKHSLLRIAGLGRPERDEDSARKSA
ncbi:MAG: TetR/AcrR family transcriptional regulator [Myxococcales bacterium]|nr:TetR/AcrR family transcriptional regulator [Myxococcales bacterium]